MTKKLIPICVLLALLSSCTTNKEDTSVLPNFIIIFTDDQGYSDVGCFGSSDIRTPNLDRMAAEGMKFTSFYAQTVCGPSRAALLTGCYPMRNARNDNGEAPHPKLSLSEVTIAEVLKPMGYATGMIGKWDLAGHNQEQFNPGLLPVHQGFDYSFLTPTSNDARVHLLRNKELVERNVDMSTLTRRYTDEAISFIERNSEQPFFLYLAHTMPHTPDSRSIASTKWPRHSAPEDRVLFDNFVLYDLENDIGETKDVAGEHPEIVAQLTKLLDWAKEDIGDFGKRGKNVRPLGDEPYMTPNELIPEKKRTT